MLRKWWCCQFYWLFSSLRNTGKRTDNGIHDPSVTLLWGVGCLVKWHLGQNCSMPGKGQTLFFSKVCRKLKFILPHFLIAEVSACSLSGWGSSGYSSAQEECLCSLYKQKVSIFTQSVCLTAVLPCICLCSVHNGVFFHQTWHSEATETVRQIHLWDNRPNWGSHLEPFSGFCSCSNLNDVLRIELGWWWWWWKRFRQATTKIAFPGWTCSIFLCSQQSELSWRAGSLWKAFFPMGNHDLSSLYGVTVGC